MTTGTNPRPFGTGSPPNRETLLAYAEGRTAPEEQHVVEAALESDPLLCEAMEGLAGPGAVAGLAGLERHRPQGAARRGGRPFLGGVVLGAVLLSAVWLAVSTLVEPGRTADGSPAVIEQGEAPASLAETPLEPEEIATSVEQPESLRIGHRPDERHALAMREPVRVAREPGAQRISDRARTLPHGEPPVARPARGGRVSRQLHYLHDLAVVHPKELYGQVPEVPIEERHVPASYADRPAQRSVRDGRRTMAYLPFLDEALGKFARHDHKGCLEDLRFLLEQYPDDVNALFYAGLCSYNLGLYARARGFLHRAATHAVDTFDEEAAWYHALTLDRLGEHEAAQEAFARIAAREGFYAERAERRMK